MQKPQVVKKINENILHQGMYYTQEVIAEKKGRKAKKRVLQLCCFNAIREGHIKTADQYG